MADREFSARPNERSPHHLCGHGRVGRHRNNEACSADWRRAIGLILAACLTISGRSLFDWLVSAIERPSAPGLLLMIMFAISAATGRSYQSVPEFRFGTAVLMLAGLVLYPGRHRLLELRHLRSRIQRLSAAAAARRHSRLRDLPAICLHRAGPQRCNPRISAQRRTQPQSLGLRHRSGRLAPGDRVMGRYRNQPSEAQAGCYTFSASRASAKLNMFCSIRRLTEV